MIEELILQFMKDNGHNINGELSDEVTDQIHEAINTGRMVFIKNNEQVIGFLTWQDEGDVAYMSNICIHKDYRKSSNLLSLRKFLRDTMKNKTFVWENNKFKRIVETK